MRLRRGTHVAFLGRYQTPQLCARRSSPRRRGRLPRAHLGGMSRATAVARAINQVLPDRANCLFLLRQLRFGLVGQREMVLELCVPELVDRPNRAEQAEPVSVVEKCNWIVR